MAKIAGFVLSFFVLVGAASAQTFNYPDRKALTINVCPDVEITSFEFENRRDDARFADVRFRQNASWKNIGTQPVIAFEIVVLKYDPFNRREIGSRWLVTGRDSAHWDPLPPGDTGSDGTIGLRDEQTFTAIAYVRSVRLADGQVWTADSSKLREEMKKAAPFLREPGDLGPDAPVKKPQ